MSKMIGKHEFSSSLRKHLHMEIQNWKGVLIQPDAFSNLCRQEQFFDLFGSSPSRLGASYFVPTKIIIVIVSI